MKLKRSSIVLKKYSSDWSGYGHRNPLAADPMCPVHCGAGLYEVWRLGQHIGFYCVT